MSAQNETQSGIGLIFAICAAIGLGLGMISSTWIATAAYKNSRSDTLMVKGIAEKRIRSDLAIWTSTLVVRDASLSGATKKLEGQLAQVMEFLREQGFSKDTVTKTAVTIHVVTKKRPGSYEQTNELEGYRLEQGLRIEMKDVDRAAKLNESTSALIGKGIELQTGSPEYFYTGLDALKVELLGLAAKDAQGRAEQLAQSNGRHAGNLKSAQQGVFQITRPNSTDTAGYGIYDTSTIDKSVRVVVTMNYAVQ